jgi:hypothetical protein
MHELKTYEVEEANRVLPQVRRLVGQIAELSTLLPDLQDQLRVTEYRMNRPGSGPEEADRYEESTGRVRGAEEDLVEALTSLEEMGITLKDPQEGLVDFYTYRDGELVELCWKLGEESVAHWHRIGEGYAGRKPL